MTYGMHYQPNFASFSLLCIQKSHLNAFQTKKLIESNNARKQLTVKSELCSPHARSHSKQYYRSLLHTSTKLILKLKKMRLCDMLAKNLPYQSYISKSLKKASVTFYALTQFRIHQCSPHAQIPILCQYLHRIQTYVYRRSQEDYEGFQITQ